MRNTSKRQRRPARSAEEWKHTVDAWRRSELTAEVYAEQHGIGAKNLYKWATRLGLGNRALGKERSGKTGPRFVAVEVGLRRRRRRPRDQRPSSMGPRWNGHRVR